MTSSEGDEGTRGGGGEETEDPDTGEGTSGGPDTGETGETGEDTGEQPACDAVGFGEASVWSLPHLSALPLADVELMRQLADGRNRENDAYFQYITSDLHGDGAVDLVITDGCDAGGVGVERWVVHAGICE